MTIARWVRLALFLVLFDSIAAAQAFEDGSGVAVAELKPAQVRNLTVLGKAWGFLKYHHPAITSGKRTWDYDLFRALPRILAAEDAAAGNAALLAWCKGVGAAPAREPGAAAPTDAHLSPELDWMRDETALGKELSAWLQAVHAHRHGGGPQHYVSTTRGVGNPKFTNEPDYRPLGHPDAGYRILALYRFWSIIEYWFPYRDLIEEDWDGVLAEFLPRLVGAEDKDAYRLELIALIARVHDTHANLWNGLDVRPPRGSHRLPVRVRFLAGKAVVVGSTTKAELLAPALEAGDVIVALDGRPIDELVRAWTPYYAASNQPTRLRDIARSLTRGPPGRVAVHILRDGAKVELNLERVPHRIDRGAWRHDRPGPTFQRLSDNVAYLKLSSVKKDEVDSYVRSAQGTKGLVIDIRNYPSSFVVWSLGSRLVHARTPFVRFTTCDLANPGAFGWGKPLALPPRAPRYEGRVVILVDETSQSSAEYTAMAFRVAPGAVVVGSTTAGADGNISHIPLPGGLRTLISGIGVFYPDKTPTQRVGIVPDVKVRPTIAGIRAGRDEVLEAGIRQILGDDASKEEIVRMARR